MKPRREIRLPVQMNICDFRQIFEKHDREGFILTWFFFSVVEILNQKWLIKFPYITMKWPFLLEVPLT